MVWHVCCTWLLIIIESPKVRHHWPRQSEGLRLQATQVACLGSRLPVKVILHVLRQVDVKEDEVMHVAPGERGLQALRSQFAAPLLNAQDGIVDDFWCRLDVLQDTLQGHVLTGHSGFHRLAVKGRGETRSLLKGGYSRWNTQASWGPVGRALRFATGAGRARLQSPKR